MTVRWHSYSNQFCNCLRKRLFSFLIVNVSLELHAMRALILVFNFSKWPLAGLKLKNSAADQEAFSTMKEEYELLQVTGAHSLAPSLLLWSHAVLI